MRGGTLTAGAAALLMAASLGVARAEDQAGVDHSKMDHSGMDHAAHGAAPSGQVQWADPGKARVGGRGSEGGSRKRPTNTPGIMAAATRAAAGAAA